MFKKKVEQGGDARLANPARREERLCRGGTMWAELGEGEVPAEKTTNESDARREGITEKRSSAYQLRSKLGN